MKSLLRICLLYIPATLLCLLIVAALFIWQSKMITRGELNQLANMARDQGIGAVYMVIKTHLTGVVEGGTDPSYGRRQVEGRGHAPWVMRGNLDGKPRMLNFALAPGIWASFDTQQASLYQLWQGDILFQGPAYNHLHGVQPISTGASFIHQAAPVTWSLEVAGEQLPATVQYLGHEYGPGQATAGFRFELSAGEQRLQLLNTPELLERAGQQVFQQRIVADPAKPGYRALMHSADGSLTAPATIETILATPVAIVQKEGSSTASDGELQRGEQVVANSDCLSCHSAGHRVTGPSWSRIASRFRNHLQEETVAALASSIINGSRGKWGDIPMPAHPAMSVAAARAAAAMILSTPETEANTDVPMDANGKPYVASDDYEVNPRLRSVHPSFELEFLLPDDFEPKVGGMDFRSDGKLVVTSWDIDGSVFLIDLAAPKAERVRRIAEGLHEPLGLAVVDDRLFVLQKQEVTELIDLNGDDIIDQYRAHSYDWPTSSNFHSFAFGLLHKDRDLYALLSVCVMSGGASCSEQLPTQGKLLRIGLDDGKATVVASGFRTPNGIGMGRDGEILVTDNQGDWLPASKLLQIRPGAFYGSKAVAEPGLADKPVTAPIVWIPQDEIGNSPSQPLLLEEGPYAGQLIYGDIYHGGIKRVATETVAGALQGAVMRFSGGFHSGVNRLLRGPDRHIYIGEIGNPPNWGEFQKPWFGLERLRYKNVSTFELLQVNAESDGFILQLTEPLAPSIQLQTSDLVARQWFYYPTEQYGGPKYDASELPVTSVTLSADRTRIKAIIPGLKPGYVVYLRLHPRLLSGSGQSLWSSEAWYTLNAIPAPAQPNAADAGWINLFDGSSLQGWRYFRDPGSSPDAWVIENGELTLQPGPWGILPLVNSYLFGGASRDLIYAADQFSNFELELEWKISVGGNSGIFYLVANEDDNTPWFTGLEMQVLDNEGHDDGQIKTHRAGDLYDLVAANPETVNPPGQWNSVRIRVQGNQLEHWLNGSRVVSISRGSEDWQQRLAASKFKDYPGYGMARSGYIVLQDHGDPVWYRNIRVRKL